MTAHWDKVKEEFPGFDTRHIARLEKVMKARCVLLEKNLINLQRSSGNFMIDGLSVEGVINEQMSIAGTMASLSNHDHEVPNDLYEWVGVDRGSWKYLTGYVGCLISEAVPYYWMEEIRMAALTDTPLPRHHVADLHFPHKAMWWTWERGILINEPGYEHLEASGLVFYTGVDLKGVRQLFTTQVEVLQADKPELEGRTPTMRFQGGTIADTNWIYPDDFDSGIQKYTYENIARLLGFINSPHIRIETHPTPRAERRRSKRVGIELPEEANFVTLRREQQQSNRFDDATGRTYDYQWVVSGHFRNQWYPGDRIHKLIWIAPYVKGPEDKPLKPRAYKVVR